MSSNQFQILPIQNKIDSNIDDPYNRRFYKKQTSTIKNDFKTIGNYVKLKTSNIKEKVKKRAFYYSMLKNRIPIINWLFLGYNFKSNLLNDLISGFTVGIMNLPQSMGYALLANLAPVNGLYMSFFPLLIYAVFGTSKHIAIGTIAIISLMSGEVIQNMADQYGKQLKYANNSSSNLTDFQDDIMKYKVYVASSLSLYVGIIQIAMVSGYNDFNTIY